MANKVNYIQIRKLDANGDSINLNLQDSIGDTLTFKEEGYTEKSSWKILTLQEFPTYYLLQVEEDNYPDNGALNNLYNALFTGIVGTPPTLNNVPFPTQYSIEAVTGVGNGAKVIMGYTDASGGGGTGTANVLRVMNQGVKYRSGDQVKFTIPAAELTNPSGGDLEVNVILTGEMIDDSTNSIVDITNIPHYASFSAEYNQLKALGPNAEPVYGTSYPIPSYLDPYNNPGGSYTGDGHLYQTLRFVEPKYTGDSFWGRPQSKDGTYGINPQPNGTLDGSVYSSSGYQFGLTPQAPIEFTLKFKNISSSDAGHFYFNMFQYIDKSGKDNVFSGTIDSNNNVRNNFRGFGLSQSITYNVGQATTGPIYIPTTVGGIDFKISGSIRAGEIQSGSVWVVGVSKDPNDFAAISPDLKWQECTWSMQISPLAKAYQTNQYAISQIEAGQMTQPTFSNAEFDGSQTFGPEAYIDPYNGLWTNWANNSWNPIAGNFQEARENTFLMDIEYNSQTGSQVPSNRFQILSGSAQKANIPDSNYTQRRVVDPRYFGCRLQSADYNFYTEEGYLGEGSNFNFGLSYFLPRIKFKKRYEAANNPVLDKFLNGDTCSIAPQYAYPTSSNATASKQWYGDISYGKNAVIDSYPKYIAHFQQSHDSYLKFGTRQFDLDALIEVPNVDVTDNQGYQAMPLPLDGDGEYQFDVAKTFEAGRDAGIFFNTYQTGGMDFSLIPGRKRRRKRRGRRRLSPKSGEIYDGGMKYTLMYTNEVGGAVLSSSLENIEYAPSYSYRKNRFKLRMQQSNVSLYRQQIAPVGGFTESIQMITGSTEYGIGDNFFMLSGSTFPRSSSAGGTWENFSQMIHFTRLPRRRPYRDDNTIPDLASPMFKNFYSLGGPQLATLHTHNYYLFNNIKARGIGETEYGRRRNLAFSPGVSARKKRNYFKFLPRNSGAPGYEYDSTPFLLQPGDEIRVTAEVSTAGYEKHTGSISTGIDPYSQPMGTSYGYQLDSLVRSRGAGWGAACTGFSTDVGALGTLYYNLGTRTNGEGTGATFRIDICCGTLLPMDYIDGGWLGAICDGYFLIGEDYMPDVTNAGAGLSNAGSPYNFILATGGSGTEARFNVTVDATGVVTACACTVPGKDYKNGDVLTFDVADIGGVGTPPTITVGTQIGVGNKPSTKMAFYDPQINPSHTTGGGSLDNLQVGLNFKGETGFKDASCTELTLYRVGTNYADGDYVIWDHTRLRAYGAGLGEPINGNIAGVTGSMMKYDDLVIRIPKSVADGGVDPENGTNTGPCNIFGQQGGTGYRPGDTVWVPKEYFSGSAVSDVEIKLSPLDLWFKDTTTVTRDFSFQVLAVSQSNYWSASKVPTDTGVYLPYTAYPNHFGWMGLETTLSSQGGEVLSTANTNWVDLLPYVNGDLPTDSGTGPLYTNVTTTSVDAPNGSGGTGLVVNVSASGEGGGPPILGTVNAIVPTNGGGDYTFGEVIKINLSAVNANFSDIFITLPMEALQCYDGDTIGNVSLCGQFGAPANKIFVHPNPKDVLYGIENGEIKRCTFRKRTPTDQSVVVEMDPPSGSLGVKTPSGDGYLIPADLSKVQRKNALSIINKLNAQNAFRKNRN